MSAGPSERLLWRLLILLWSIRLASLGMYPLLDPSEARYGEVARKMLELGNWVTPMFDYGIPFWGKPPLSFWTQAASMQWLGVNAFAARLPALLFHIAVCLFIVRLGREWRDRRTGLVAGVLYSSCVLGVAASGAVLTDAALSFSLALAYCGFWFGVARGNKPAALAGFAGLGLGLLAKGPVALALFGIAAAAWVVVNRPWKALRELPWVGGVLLIMGIAVPWYVLAELRTPGFLDYFLLGEHWNRFLVSGWSGDRYGSAHAEPFGMIWLQLLGALLPWSLALPLLYLNRRELGGEQAALRSFIWCWAVATPVFFTLSGNVLWTYVLPALPAWSLLLADGLTGRAWTWSGRLIATGSLVIPAILLGLIFEGQLLQRPHNQRDIALAWKRLNIERPAPLLYFPKRSYAAEFYSHGRARTVDGAAGLVGAAPFYIARRDREVSQNGWPHPLSCTPRARASQTTLYYCGS